MGTLQVYWQPGCTSCLKVKEFLREHALEFESINVREHPDAMASLAARGVRSVPVIVRGDDLVLGQNIDDVAAFVGVTLTARVCRTLCSPHDSWRCSISQLTSRARFRTLRWRPHCPDGRERIAI